MNSTDTGSAAKLAPAGASRTRALADSPEMTSKAIQFLCQSTSSFPMSPEEANSVIPVMRLVNYPANSVVYREHDDIKPSYMLLLLEGDVSVDIGTQGRTERVAISVLGPGALIGEMSMLDSAPRSANCTAITPVTAAGLSMVGLELLVNEQPSIAFKLLAYTACNTIDRLRALSEQLQMLDRVNENLHEEIARLKG